MQSTYLLKTLLVHLTTKSGTVLFHRHDVVSTKTSAMTSGR